MRSAFQNIERRQTQNEREIRRLRSGQAAIAAGDTLILATAPTHGLLSLTHSDTLPAGPQTGSIIVGNATPKWSRLVRSVPAAGLRNVLALDNGDTIPSWKTVLDTTNPEDVSAVAAAPGTSLIFARRDHVHFMSGGGYTDEQAQDAVGGILDDTATIQLVYDDVTPAITANLLSLTGFDTGDLSEGANLYFTDERAQDAIGSILLDSSSINFTYDDGTPSITGVVIPGGVDHNQLANLTAGDVHTHYLLLAGRAGGQTAYGGTASGNDLTLKSTSDATKGSIFMDELDGLLVNGYARIGSLTAPTTTTAGHLQAVNLLLGDDAAQFTQAGVTAALHVARTDTVDPSVVGAKAFSYWEYQIKPTATGAGDFRILNFLIATVFDAADTFNIGTSQGIVMDLRHRMQGDLSTEFNFYSALGGPDNVFGTAGDVTLMRGFVFQAVGRNSTTGTIATATAFEARAPSLGAGPMAITDHRGLYVRNLGAASVTNAVAIDIDAQSGAATLNVGIRNASNQRQTGYFSLQGATVTPENVTNGDFSSIRAIFGDDTAFDTLTNIGGTQDDNTALFVQEAHTPPSVNTTAVLVHVTLTPDATAGGAGRHEAMGVYMHVQPSASNSQRHVAMIFTATHDSGAFDLTSASALTGVQGEAIQSVASSTVNNAFGGTFNVSATAGTISNALGVNVNMGLAGDAGDIALQVGVRVTMSATAPSGGVITRIGFRSQLIGASIVDNAYGILVDTQTAANEATYGAHFGDNRVAIGTNQPGINNDATDGLTALSRTMMGLELGADHMNTSSKYTAALKFMSSDGQFTTENPKFLAAIVGEATETYNGDDDGGMDIVFFATPNTPGTTNVPTEMGRWHNNVGNPELFIGVDGVGTQHALVITGGASGNEGAEIQMRGSGSQTDWQFDNQSGNLRWFENATLQFFLHPSTAAAAGASVAGFLRVGVAGTIPTNATAGDLTALRAVIGANRAIGAILHVVQPTLGSEAFRIESTATNDDPSERVFQNRVATTNNTTTTIATVAIPASTTVFIEAYVVARRTGGASGTAEDGAGYIVRGVFKNVAGTATSVTAISAEFTEEDQAAFNATFTLSGGNVLIQVTGATGNDITWHVTYRTWRVSS